MNEYERMRDQERRQRERILFLYTDALLRGDMEALGLILAQAETDPILEQAIWEVQLTISDSLEEQDQRAIARAQAQAAVIVQDLLAGHFTAKVLPVAPVEEDPIGEMPEPITIGEVAADLKSKSAGDPAAREALQRLAKINIPLSDVSLRGVRSLLAQLDIGKVSRQFVDMFHDAALSLSLQRQQKYTLLAATRRQRPPVAQETSFSYPDRPGTPSAQGEDPSMESEE